MLITVFTRNEITLISALIICESSIINPYYITESRYSTHLKRIMSYLAWQYSKGTKPQHSVYRIFQNGASQEGPRIKNRAIEF